MCVGVGGGVRSVSQCCFCHRYNVVFKYLLSVRRVQAELQHCWALQMQRKHLKSNQTDAVKWRLRNHMAFLVDNLQYYLQVRSVQWMEEVGKGAQKAEKGLLFCIW
jgi:hypothetical protein